MQTKAHGPGANPSTLRDAKRVIGLGGAKKSTAFKKQPHCKCIQVGSGES